MTRLGILLAMTLPILHTVDSRASTQLLCAYVWEHRKLWSALLDSLSLTVIVQIPSLTTLRPVDPKP